MIENIFWFIYRFTIKVKRKLKTLFIQLEIGYLKYSKVLEGNGFTIGEHVVLSLEPESHLIIGKGVYIGDYSWITVHKGATLCIGDHTFIAHNCSISSGTHCKIGTYCAIAPYVTLIDVNHRYEDKTRPLRFQGGDYEEYEVGDETWIGTGATILKGVKLGKHCVVGANSVVTMDISEYSVAVGSPAKIIKKII